VKAGFREFNRYIKLRKVDLWNKLREGAQNETISSGRNKTKFLIAVLIEFLAGCIPVQTL